MYIAIIFRRSRLFFIFTLVTSAVAQTLPWCEDPHQNEQPSALVTQAGRDLRISATISSKQELVDQKTKEINIFPWTEIPIYVKEKLDGKLSNGLGWSNTTAVLARLEAIQRKKLLKAADLSLSMVQLKSLSAQEIGDRARSLEKFAEMAALDRALYPPVSEAIGLRQALSEGSSEIKKIAQDTTVTFLRDRYRQILSKARESNVIRFDETVQVVGAGDRAPSGGLSDVPNNKPVRIDNVYGKLCLRPITEYAFDVEKFKINRAWDPTAFPDVGLLYNQYVDNPDLDRVCSFVRISKDHILTAAHCVARASDSGTWSALQFNQPNFKAFALLPDLSTTTRSPSRCIHNTGDCGFYIATLSESPKFPDGALAEIKNKVPSPDVAIVRATFLDAPAPTTAISKKRTTNKVTLAGYGIGATDEKGDYGGELLVGWNEIDRLVDETLFAWVADSRAGKATICIGDSGGAVFDGEIAAPGDPRLVIGIVSFSLQPMKGTESEQMTLKYCDQAKGGRATSLERYSSWICNQTGNSALGCTQIQQHE